MKYMIYTGMAAVAVLFAAVLLCEIPFAAYRRKKDRDLSVFLKIPAVLLVAVLLGAACTFGYLSIYQKADDSVSEFLISDVSVTVRETDFGYTFDGWGTESALVFYPGAKVDEKAYAPLMKKLAEQGVDCFLLKVPYHLAVLDMEAAGKIIEGDVYHYAEWFVGGHSLGGNTASRYASEHADELAGLILLGAYPSAEIDDQLMLLSVYGSEDQILDLAEYQKAYEYWPKNCRETIVTGGNHSQFGSYGLQKGDGEAEITAELQQRLTSEIIRLMVRLGR